MPASLLVLSHASALDYWRRRFTHDASPIRLSKTNALPNAMPSSHQAKWTAQALLESNEPVHVLVSRAAHRGGQAHGIAVHSFSGELPAGTLARIDEHTLVASPFFCLLQMAADSTIPLERVAATGCELCGTYYPDPSQESGIGNRPPLATRNDIARFAEAAQGRYGVKRLKRAASFMMDNAASPMETALALLLTLPGKLGGYGFPQPRLNHRIDLVKRSKDAAHRSYYKCDLYWPEQKVAIEYDSDFAHTGSERIANDAKRRNALEHGGVRVVTVTKSQLFDGRETEKVAKLLSTYLGKRARTVARDCEARRAELRRSLLAL